MKAKPAKASTTISFRFVDLDNEEGLSAEELADLARAEAQKYGISAHELARQVFLDWLMDHERHAVAEALGQVQEELSKQRADLREAVICLLCDAGKAERQDAEEWVSTHLCK
jgi:hypothetical protein